jgi:ABC-type molybdate transport system substrate-binding protein
VAISRPNTVPTGKQIIKTMDQIITLFHRES